MNVLRHPRRSRDGGEETSVRFINHTDRKVDLWWIDLSGKRKSYGSIKPGQEHRQHIFARHVWLVTGKDGQQMGVIEAVGDVGDAIIGGRHVDEEPDETRREQTDRNRSSDGRWRAVNQDHYVIVRDLKSGEESPLSSDGSAELP